MTWSEEGVGSFPLRDRYRLLQPNYGGCDSVQYHHKRYIYIKPAADNCVSASSSNRILIQLVLRDIHDHHIGRGINRNRQTHRQTDRQTDRQIDRQRQTDRQTKRQTGKQRDRQTTSITCVFRVRSSPPPAVSFFHIAHILCHFRTPVLRCYTIGDHGEHFLVHIRL